MKVVLLENIKGVGQRGEIKEVKDGYGMNFLIPQGKVKVATVGNAKQAQLEVEKQKEQEESSVKQNKELAQKLNKTEIIIKAKAQKEKLFGALTEKDIKNALQKEGMNIGAGKIKLNKTIKATGDFEVDIDWGEGIQANIIIKVVEES